MSLLVFTSPAMEAAVELEERLDAPVEAGQQGGRMTVTRGVEEVKELFCAVSGELEFDKLLEAISEYRKKVISK